MPPDPPNILASRFALALTYNIYTYRTRPPLQQNPGTATASLFLAYTSYGIWDGDSLCALSNLQILFLNMEYTPIQGFTCLPHLRRIRVLSNVFLITNTSFQGLDNLSQAVIFTKEFYMWNDTVIPKNKSIDALIHLQTATELICLDIRSSDLKKVDIWPLCLAQTHPGIVVSLTANLADFTSSLSTAKCNAETPLLANTEIDLRNNAITQVSDIADGWGFSSLHHFITSLMRDNSTDFPIYLEGNPFTCDCRDLDLYRLLRDPQYSKHLANLANLTCHRPLYLKGRQFRTVLDSGLDCHRFPLPLAVRVTVGLLAAVFLLGWVFCKGIGLYRWSGLRLHPWDRDECIGENKEFGFVVSPASADEEWTLPLIENLESPGV